MDLNSINSALFDLYESYLPNLKELYDETDKLGISDYSFPLLLSCHEGYLKAKKRIVFIGQETFSWWANKGNKVTSKTDIKRLQENYLNFMLPQTYSSPFWNFIYEISGKNFGVPANYMWSNVLKIGKLIDKGRPDYRVTELETKYFNVGKEEIGILKPDILVFLSGPKYDRDIKSHFGEFDIVQNIDCCFDELKIEGIACKAYRLYHPNYHNYLGYDRKEEYKNKLVQLLK